MTALSKTVFQPSVIFTSDEIAAAGGPWKNFTIRVTAQNETGSARPLELKLTNVVTDIRLTNQGTLATSDSADFVTQVTGAEKPSSYAGTSVTFRDYDGSFAIAGNGFTKSANPGYGTNLWTREYTINSGSVSGEFISHDTVMGLSNNGQALAGIASLEFALVADAADEKVKVYESGAEVYNTQRPITGIWAIAYDGVSVRYFCDGTLVYNSFKTITAGWTMYAGFNAKDIGDSIKNVQFGIMGDQALAQLAINTIANIASDNQITAGNEKRSLLDTYTRLDAETTRLVRESESFVLLYTDQTPNERNASLAAMQSLNDFLNVLSPPWTTINVNTPVDGAVLSARFKTLILANVALQTANNIVLRKHADWDGVVGKGKDDLIDQARRTEERVNVVTSDDWLSANEKPQVIIDFNNLLNDRDAVEARFVALGAPSGSSSAREDAFAAIATLYNYMMALTPSYSDTTKDTPIVGVNYRSIWVTALQKLSIFRSYVAGTPGPKGADGFTNILDTSSWIPGNEGTQIGRFAINGEDGENSIVLSAGPTGASEPLWRMEAGALAGSVAGEADGGWNYLLRGAEEFSTAKSYRFMVWAYHTARADSASFYFGTAGSHADGMVPVGAGGDRLNPYFWSGALPERNKWFLLVGIVHGSSYTGGDSGISGVYDPATGQRVAAGIDWKQHPDSTYLSHRAYHFYATHGSLAYFGKPSVEEVGNTTFTIQQLFATVGMTAQQAQALQQATSRINAIASDSILSAGSEKSQALQDWTALSDDSIALHNRYLSLGSPSDLLAVKNQSVDAVAALFAYLSGLTPAWDDTTSDTPIVASVWRQMWGNAMYAVSTFRAAITGRKGADSEIYTLSTAGGDAPRPAGFLQGLRNAAGQALVDPDTGNLSSTYARSFTVCFRRGANDWKVRHFDVFGLGAEQYPSDNYAGGERHGVAGMINLLDALPAGTPVIVYTSDEPENHHLDAGLPEAMYRCGASPEVFGKPWQYRSAYTLVGVKGWTQGRGFEQYAGGFRSDPNAIIQTGFTIINGIPVAALPGRDGNGPLTLIAMSPSTKVTTNSVRGTASLGWGNEAAYSLEAYSGGAVCTFTLPPSHGDNMMAGLSAGVPGTPADLSFGSLTFAIYRQADGYTDIRINGALRVVGPTVTGALAGRVHFDGRYIRWFINNVMIGEPFDWMGTTLDPNQHPLHFRCALASNDPRVENITLNAAGTLGAKGADGINPPVITASATPSSISYNSDNAIVSGPVTFTAVTRNAIGPVAWSSAVSHGLYNTPGVTISADGLSITLSQARMADVLAHNQYFYGVASETMIASVSGASFPVTVTKVKDGERGPKGNTGDNSTVPGPPGRDAIVFQQDATPTNPVIGDTWVTLTPPYIWRKWNGSAWVKILGNVSALDIIDEAYIANLSVGTIKIANGAITNNIVVGSNAVVYRDSFVDCGSLSMNIFGGAVRVDVRFRGSLEFYSGGIQGDCYYYIVRVKDGVETRMTENIFVQQSYQTNTTWFVDSPGPGTATYRMYAFANGGSASYAWILDAINLLAMEFKK